MGHPHGEAIPSPPVRTYTSDERPHGPTITCRRCRRVYAYPADGGAPVKCECGWWYANRGGMIQEEFRSRLGV